MFFVTHGCHVLVTFDGNVEYDILQVRKFQKSCADVTYEHMNGEWRKKTFKGT